MLSVYKHCLLGPGERGLEYRFELPRLAAYSGHTVRRIQKEVLTEFPAWRIVIADDFAHRGELFIEHDTLRTDGGCVVDDVDAHMNDLRVAEQQGRDRTQGSTLRQLNHVRLTIPELMRLVSDARPCDVIDIFDNSRGNFDRLSVWTLSRNGSSIAAFRGDEGSCGIDLPVGDDGIAHSYEDNHGMWTKLYHTAKVWLIQSIVPASYHGNTLIYVEVFGPHATVTFQCELTIDRTQIVRDADVPRIELP